MKNITISKKLICFLKQNKWSFIFCNTIYLIQIIIHISTPYLYRIGIDFGISNKRVDIVILISSILILFLLYTLLIIPKAYELYTKGVTNVVFNFKLDLLRRIVSIRKNDIDSLGGAPALKARIEDEHHITELFHTVILNLFHNSILVIGYIIFIIIFSPYFLLIYLLVIPLIWYKSNTYSITIRRLESQGFDAYKESEKAVLKTLYGHLFLKLHKAEEYFNKYLSTKILTFYRKRNKHMISMNKSEILNQVIYELCSVLTFLLGAILIINNRISYGEWFALFSISLNIIMPLTSLGSVYEKIKSNLNGVNRLNELYELNYFDCFKPIKQESKKHNDSIPLIQFKNVNCSYIRSRRNFTLSDICFSIRKGNKIAIVGESGSGKTTILNLMIKMIEKQSGYISILGIPIEEYSLKDVLKNISYCYASDFFFETSIQNNITLLRNDIRQSAIRNAYAVSQIESFINSLPDKEKTKMLDNGSNFSAGQKQRLEIARELVQNSTAKIFLFDEMTSNIDLATESMFFDTLFSHDNHKDKAFIFVMHRLSQMNYFNNIIVLDKGRIVENGSHFELIKMKGIYCDLYNKYFQENTK